MNKGFIALVTVLTFSILSTAFVISTAAAAWMWSNNIIEYSEYEQARFDAISCIAVVQTQIASGLLPEIGSYPTENGVCSIKNFQTVNGKKKVLVSSEYSNQEISFEAIIDPGNLKTISLSETTH